MQLYKITEYTIYLKKKMSDCRKEAWKEISPFSRSKLSKEMMLVNGLLFMQLQFFWRLWCNCM